MAAIANEVAAPVRQALLTHLTNVIYDRMDYSITLGTVEELAAVTKILADETLSKSTRYFSEFPKLGKNQYVVGCIDRFIHVRVMAVYTLDQMRAIQNSVDKGYANNVKWRVLEINPSLEKELREEIKANPLEPQVRMERLSDHVVVISDELAPAGSAKHVSIEEAVQLLAGLLKYEVPDKKAE